MAHSQLRTIPLTNHDTRWHTNSRRTSRNISQNHSARPDHRIIPDNNGSQ
ncbi:hypothetical protein SAMN05216355_101162 [Actinomyces ruminicola]|uniref:Uncharacterized protein n=1 Tax=Actinomyces ruminicola TaxID=332524 RepID=A0A1G9ZGD6_9ACTO|nr:hypothetical protein SAMN05216355_101162 [Actinomyces ruminicola]